LTGTTVGPVNVDICDTLGRNWRAEVALIVQDINNFNKYFIGWYVITTPLREFMQNLHGKAPIIRNFTCSTRTLR